MRPNRKDRQFRASATLETSNGFMKGARTLIVDDDSGMRLVVRMLAEEAGCLVVAEAANGREAVELAVQHRPDLVIMDLSMPVMDGVEATARIVRDCPETTVVAWTTAESAEERERVLAAGARRFVHKGDRDALADVLRAA